MRRISKTSLEQRLSNTTPAAVPANTKAGAKGLGIAIRLDRLRWNSWKKQGAKVPQIPGFKVVKDYRPAPLGKTPAYGRVRKLKSLTSDTKVDWEYSRSKGWLRPWRITLIADDATGLTPVEASKFIGRSRFYHFLIVELALDFGPGSGVDYEFVRRHALFGKSRRRRDIEKPGQLRYGDRKAAKFIRCYWKEEVNAFRVELELHSPLLRSQEIKKLRDLSDVPFVILPKHLKFVQIRWKALRRYLSRKFDDAGDKIFSKTQRYAATSIHKAVRYLRRKSVNNPHRFLAPMLINDVIEKALTTWAIDFQEGINE